MGYVAAGLVQSGQNKREENPRKTSQNRGKINEDFSEICEDFSPKSIGLTL